MRITYIHFPTVSICVFLMYVQCLYIEKDNGPVMSVKGNVKQFSEEITTVKLGETVEIICTKGKERMSDLDLYRYNKPEIFYTESETMINSTSWVINIDELNMAISCISATDYIGFFDRNSLLISTHTLIGDSPINVINFHCQSNNLVSLHCTWTTSCTFAGFKLYVTDNNEQTSIICDIPLHLTNRFKHDLSCSWDIYRIPRYNPKAVVLNLTIEFCNYTLCLNETHVFDHLSIVKLDPPILDAPYHDFSYYVFNNLPTITLRWIIHSIILLDGVEHRIQYSKLGGRPHEANILKFENTSADDSLAPPSTFVAVLSLPCYDREYEFSVSVKSKQAVGEEYWSDYQRTILKTNPRHADEQGTDDATCSDLDMDETPEIMKYLVKNFRADFKHGQLKLKNEIKKLTEKVSRMDKHK